MRGNAKRRVSLGYVWQLSLRVIPDTPNMEFPRGPQAGSLPVWCQTLRDEETCSFAAFVLTVPCANRTKNPPTRFCGRKAERVGRNIRSEEMRARHVCTRAGRDGLWEPQTISTNSSFAVRKPGSWTWFPSWAASLKGVAQSDMHELSGG